MSFPNTPARLDRLARARALIVADREQQVHPQYTLDALDDLGATCTWSGSRWRLFYCSVSATTPTWAPRTILDAWADNAAAALGRHTTKETA